MTAAFAAYSHFCPVRPYVDPELKASQPHHRKKRPTQALIGLPIGGGGF